jgi:ribosome-binding factor A
MTGMSAVASFPDAAFPAGPRSGMSQRRIAKVAQAIRQVVSSAILIGLRDPRVKRVTVLNVEVPPDLRSAKVYVSIMGDDKAARLSLQGLESARGWLQKKIADELELRYTPILSFVVDEGVKRSIEASRVLKELDSPTAAEDDDTGDLEDAFEKIDDSGDDDEDSG